MNATDKLREKWTEGDVAEYLLVKLAEELQGDCAVVDGKLYAIGMLWNEVAKDGVTTTWAGLVPPSGETAA